MSKIPAGWKGMGDPVQSGTDKDLSTLVPYSWFYNWDYQYPQRMIDARFVPMVWCSTDTGTLQSYASRYPGKYWMIFNEPDWVGQCDITPAVAASRYDSYYNAIKAGDATAKVGGINLTAIDANGYTNGGNYNNYLPDFLAAITNPLDFYCVHDWIARDPMSGGQPTWGRLALHLDYIQTLTKLQNKDVWLTESGATGAAYSEANSIAARDNYAKPLVAWLHQADGGFDNRIVRVAWFSTEYSDRDDDLLTTVTPPALSPLGTYWKGVNDMSELNHFVRADKDGDGDYDPLTSTSWDGDSFSTSTGTINWNTLFGVPTAAKAVAVRIQMRDSGAAGTSVFALKAKSTTVQYSVLLYLEVGGDQRLHINGDVPIAANGTSYYSIEATGVGTMDIWIYVVGWYV